MTFHVPGQCRVRTGVYGSDETAGNNGLFEVWWRPHNAVRFRVIASDGMGWEHVSVSLPDSTPTWEDMCRIKGIFWDEEDAVVQFHPPRSQYVNIAQYCLHLWRPTGERMPMPPSILVGPRP